MQLAPGTGRVRDRWGGRLALMHLLEYPRETLKAERPACQQEQHARCNGGGHFSPVCSMRSRRAARIVAWPASSKRRSFVAPEKTNRIPGRPDFGPVSLSQEWVYFTRYLIADIILNTAYVLYTAVFRHRPGPDLGGPGPYV